MESLLFTTTGDPHLQQYVMEAPFIWLKRTQKGFQRGIFGKLATKQQMGMASTVFSLVASSR